MLKDIWKIFIRYLIILLLAFPDLLIFYWIFTPLTIYPVYFIEKLLFSAQLINYGILIDDNLISIAEACVSGAAYYLLFMLNMSVSMDIKKRLMSIAYSFSVFLILNIIRILVLSYLLINDFVLFDSLHLISWHILSTVMVFVIWFSCIKIFKIRNIPVYTDIKSIIK